jgi:hypothetical protein
MDITKEELGKRKQELSDAGLRGLENQNREYCVLCLRKGVDSPNLYMTPEEGRGFVDFKPHGECSAYQSAHYQTMILKGWKDIAKYLGCGVRTVQRWEKLGLPVRRPAHRVASFGKPRSPAFPV